MSKLTSKCCNAEVVKSHYLDRCKKCKKECSTQAEVCGAITYQGFLEKKDKLNQYSLYCTNTKPCKDHSEDLKCPICSKDMTRVRGGGMECFNCKCNHLNKKPFICIECTLGIPCYGDNWGCDCKCTQQKRPECYRMPSYDVSWFKLEKIKDLIINVEDSDFYKHCSSRLRQECFDLIKLRNNTIDEVLAILNEK